MASSGDIRDIMNLGHDGPRLPALKKKKKLAESSQRLSGISREVQALMGDSVPPVAIIEQRKYKTKPSISHKMYRVRHWDERSFVHGARKDGLQLRHWKRSIPGTGTRAPAVINGTINVDTADGGSPAMEAIQFEEEFPSEKWNVDFSVTTYNDEQYEKYLQSDDWSKNETDYLFSLCGDYDLRWILIADRYDHMEIPRPTSVDAENAVWDGYPSRSMEALKARYYTISARMLEVHTPASQMTNTEFSLWEKMRNFDAKAEVTRKAMAEKLFDRTKDEADEEKVLLEELHRITKNEEDFMKTRKDLYSRLETAPSLRRNERGEEQSTALYQTSHGLGMLLSGLLAKERKLKRPVQNGADTASSAATPSDAKPRHGNARRETMDSQADDGPVSKKGSVSQPVIKPLSPVEEAKYGVSHPTERLTSGVTFRHEKINRITTAKSQVQTQKIQSALTELGIPPRLLMPTERVCREFERLVTEVQLLLDARRTLEKVTSERKVLEEHKRIRLGQPEEGEEHVNGSNAMEVDNTTALSEQQEKNRALQSANGEAAATAAVNLQTNAGNNDDESARDDSETKDADDDDEDIDVDVDRSAVADNEDDDDDIENSIANNDDDEEDNEEAEDEDQDEIRLDDEDDEDDDDAPGLEDLEKANQITDDEDEEERENGSEEEEEEQDGLQDDDDLAEIDESIVNGDEQDGEDEEDISRPTSAHSTNARSQKRSASVISDASRAGSNRSGASRKKRR